MFRICYYHSLFSYGSFVPTDRLPKKVKTFSLMSFLNPLFLIALLTVAVPLLIYLLNLRKPKKVRFSTLAFFDSLKTTALKRIRIKRWLLLAIRMLAIIALVVAASRPYLPSGLGVGNENQPKAIGVLIDNSPGMIQVDRNGPYIEQAIEIAREVVHISDSDDRFLLNVTHGEALVSSFLTHGEMLNHIDSIEPVNKGNYFKTRLLQFRDRLEEAEEPNKIIYLVTNARESHFEELIEDFEENNSEVTIQVLKLGTAESANTGFGNVIIQAGGLERNGQIQLRSVIENKSNQPAENQFLSLLIDGELISQQPLTIEPESTTEFVFDLPVTNQTNIHVELLIEGDEISFDNRYYASIQLPETRRVLVIEDQQASRVFNSYLKPLLDVTGSNSDRYDIRFEAIQDLQLTDINEYDAIILDGVRDIPDYLIQSLVDHMQAGPGLLFLPAAEGNMNSYNRLLAALGAGRYVNVTGSYGSFNTVDQMAEPEDGHPVLESIFDKDEAEGIQINSPELFYYYEIEPSRQATSIPILTNRTGKSLLQEIRVGNGKFIYSAIGSDPGWSNFPIKPFFAPFFFRTVEYLSQGESAKLNEHILGDSFRVLINQNSNGYEIEKEDEVIIPEIRQVFQGTELSYSAEEWSPGWVSIKTDESSIEYSVNLDAMESNLKTLDESDIKQILGNYFSGLIVVETDSGIDEMISELETASSFGREIWFWFIIVAIILLITESLVARFYKAESIA